ncbi:mannose-6-phosphate isomerase 1-like isoform X2 [Mangifera indica]|uniref:mannose-6-phosphate isomerase 1-like isoform X2 n=1 Tax=Mangifera indica TaxID=29780 RepID=UPI001CFAB36C|nr:mannose-6-phosphate isomerase 1-like isoform X2 [Mangifera indica]
MDSNFNSKPLLRLTCSVQNYDWGRPGRDSLVARLYGLNSGGEVELDRCYAEFWMGTHKSGPSFVVKSGLENGNENGDESGSLKSWILKNPNVLGDKVLLNWGCHLPFLFKVLSVAKPLSIQAHPDKELAQALHKLMPHVYKDDNHKPEMALAITEFEALCSFISLQGIKSVVQNVPEIVELVDRGAASQVLHINEQDGEENFKYVMHSVFTQLMTATKERTAKAISNLKIRLHEESKVRSLTEKEQLVLRLEKQYPGDIGVLSAFFFNYVKLKPGEALYLGANEPHAYISGECVECMASSDNVIRAGLTPKDRDIQVLCSMLTYKLI